MPSEPSPPVLTPPAQAVDQRLHPSSAIFTLLSALRGLIAPLVLVVFFSRGSSMFVYFGVIGVVVAMVGFLIRYVSFRYRLDVDELVIREGILTRNERHVPYSRIQNIDLLQNPVHRALGVAEVRLETASGGKPEAVIRVLSLDAVNEMRRRVFADRDPAAAAAVEPGAPADAAPATAAQQAAALFHLPIREIVIYGLVSNRGMVVVAAAFGLATQFGLFDFDEQQIFDDIAARVPEQLSLLDNRVTMWIVTGVALVLGAIVLMRVLSIVLAIVKLYDFTLTRRGDDLRADYGLFTKLSTTIPVHRIQKVSVRQTLMLRWFNRASLQVETAGGGAEGGEGNANKERQWLAPIIARDRVADLVREVLPDVDIADVDWQPVEARAWRRRVKGGSFLIIVLTLGLFAGLRWPPLLLLALPLLAWMVLWARRSVAAEGWSLSPSAVFYRSGWVGRRVSVVRFAKIQALGRVESPFDRRHRMASVQVDTAGAGRIGHRLDIPYLATATADRVLDRLYREASLTDFRW